MSKQVVQDAGARKMIVDYVSCDAEAAGCFQALQHSIEILVFLFDEFLSLFRLGLNLN